MYYISQSIKQLNINVNTGSNLSSIKIMRSNGSFRFDATY